MGVMTTIHLISSDAVSTANIMEAGDTENPKEPEKTALPERYIT